MKHVKIVGGGLTGILAAFQAHRLGARSIDLYERLDRIGGIALPEIRDGREMREGCVYFGPDGDPIRSLLEAHGATFQNFDNRFGSVSPGSEGPIYVDDFGGPALETSGFELTRPNGDRLSDRLACYEDGLAARLKRYVEWHVGSDAAQLHESAAVPLAINRVFPVGVSADSLSAAKHTNVLADELLGIPRSLWAYPANAQASLPTGGFAALFGQCQAALNSIGVRIHERSLASPRKMLGEVSSEDIVVWAASPMPLFKAVGLDAPRAPAKKFATYTFEARWTGPLPFYVQNFTAQGSCFRVYIYESGGSILLTAECVSAEDGEGLIEDIHRLLEGFDGRLALGNLLYRTMKPRWLYHSTDTMEKLGKLRATLKAVRGTSFVTGAWEAYAKGDKFADLETQLQEAFQIRTAAEAA